MNSSQHVFFSTFYKRVEMEIQTEMLIKSPRNKLISNVHIPKLKKIMTPKFKVPNGVSKHSKKTAIPNFFIALSVIVSICELTYLAFGWVSNYIVC